MKTKPEKIVRTTLHLPEETHTKLKVYCAKRGLTVKAVVTQWVEDGLKYQR